MIYIPLEYADLNEENDAYALGKDINVRFCRDCPLFERDYWQKDPSHESGWCRRMSDYLVAEDDVPYYVNVYEDSFCNEDYIGEDDK